MKKEQKSDVTSEVSEDSEALKKKIAELEAKVQAGEEAALARVCKALKVDPEDVEAAEAPKKPEKMIECFVRTPVTVNGTKYHGKVRVPYSTFEVISQAIGDRQQRHLKELTGNEYVLEQISGGGFAPRLVGKVDITGERIA